MLADIVGVHRAEPAPLVDRTPSGLADRAGGGHGPGGLHPL